MSMHPRNPNRLTHFECTSCFRTLSIETHKGYFKPASFDDPFQRDVFICKDCYEVESTPTGELRPTWEEICMDTAIKLAKRSTCKIPDRQVGCLVVTADHSAVLAWGYNGGAADSDEPCDFDPEIEKGSRCNCAHAEMNALTKLNSAGHKDLIMYITLQPCQLCATLIVNAKCFKEVVYLSEYRDEKPVFTLRAAGIEVRQAERCKS